MEMAMKLERLRKCDEVHFEFVAMRRVAGERYLQQHVCTNDSMQPRAQRFDKTRFLYQTL